MKIELSEPTINAIKRRIKLEKQVNNKEISMKYFMEKTSIIDLEISSRVKSNFLAEIA